MKMITTMAAAILACSCVTDVEDDSQADESETTSELTGTVTCVGLSGGPAIREGTCTASSIPTSWTIQAGIGTWIGSTPALTTSWRCTAPSGTRLVTAVGVGTAVVGCSRYAQ